MKRTKQTFINLSFLLLCCNLFAQEQTRHEFGIQLSNLQGFSLIYKKEREQNKYVRVQVGSGNYNHTYRKEKDPLKQLNLTLSGGVEKRKSMGPKTNFIHGFAPHVSILSRKEVNSKLYQNQLGIAYILGLQYIIQDKFYISLESLPSIAGFISKINNSDTEAGINIGFYNNIANITLAHYFRRTEK